MDNFSKRSELCRRFLQAVGVVVLLGLASGQLRAQATAIKKVAFLVGVSQYDKAGLNPLDYPETDMSKLGDALKGAGFTVHTMLGAGAGTSRATGANLKAELIEKFATKQVRQLNRQDVLLIVLSGHGLQLLASRDGKAVEDSFFCPVDAIKSDTDSLLSISELMQRVSANSGAENNLLVIDACRDNPSKGAKSLDGSLVTALPVNMAVLFGASAGTRSYESQKLQSGLLAHYFLEGLKGAAGDRDGDVTWGTLVNFVKKNVSRNSHELVGQLQRPNDISNLQGEPPLLAKTSLPLNNTPNNPAVIPLANQPLKALDEASKEAARQELQLFEANLKRAERLFEIKAMSQQEYNDIKFIRDIAAAKLAGNALELARLRFQVAEAALVRAQELFASKSISQEDLDKATQDRNTTKANYEALQGK